MEQVSDPNNAWGLILWCPGSNGDQPHARQAIQPLCDRYVWKQCLVTCLSFEQFMLTEKCPKEQ